MSSSGPILFLITLIKKSWVSLRRYSGPGLGSGDGVSVLAFLVEHIFSNYFLGGPLWFLGKVLGY